MLMNMKTALNYHWKFLPGFQEDYLTGLPNQSTEIDIPHSPVILSDDYFREEDYQGVFTYEKRFDKPSDDTHQIHGLVFEGIMLKGHVFLNGHDLGEHISGFYEIRLDVTDYLKEKDNRLIVKVDSREDKNIPPFGNVVDYMTFAGIYRPVYLESLPKTHFRRLDILKSDMDGNLEIRSRIENNTPETKAVYSLFDQDGTEIKNFKDGSTKIEEVHLWSVDDPYLYTLKGTIIQNGKEIHSLTRKVGFRTYSFTDKGFFLNGTKLKLIGLNRHQSYPEFGIAAPRSLHEEDAHLIKYGCGANIVRTSHYPQSEDFLSECDRIGLLVQTEVPGWQFVDKTNQTWRNNFLSFIRRMVEKEINHTSIISYGIRVDESVDDDNLYSKAIGIVKELDPYRKTTGVRNFKTSSFLEDYYSYNDFSCSNIHHGLDNPKSIKVAKGKGILISENMGHMYPTKQFDEPERRIQHVLRHLKVLNDAYKYPYLGDISWCAFDYNTHKEFGSGDRVCYHGVMDIFRNRKDAAFAYLSQNSKEPMMHIANPYQAGDYDECRILPLYILTNGDEIRLYRNGRFISSFFPDRNDYPNLPYPPIIVDDFIGDTFDEGFSKKDSQKIVKALNYVGRVGYANMKKTKVLPALLLTMLHGKKITDLFEWYSKYVAGWGSETSTVELVLFKDGKEVIRKKLGPSTKFRYEIKPSKTILTNSDTYDATRVSIRYLDEYDTQLHYAFKPLHLKTTGPIEVMGKKDIVLKGGDVSVYVRSLPTEEETKAELIILTPEGEKKVEFLVR